MKIIEATHGAKEGKHFKRTPWKDCYVSSLPGLKQLLIVHPEALKVDNWVATIEDISADDYEVL
jgi:hypothetical protein